MSRPSDPLLAWLRQWLDAHDVSVAEVARRMQITRPRARKLVTGAEPMTLDEFVLLTQALGVDPTEVSGAEATPAQPSPVRAVPAPVDLPDDACQAERVLRLAFDQQIDVQLRLHEPSLEGWGGPDAVREAWAGKDLPIQLLATYHKFMEPAFTAEGFGVTLSFDRLYRCQLPWAAVRSITCVPMPPKAAAPEPPPAPEPRPRPTLRLVK